MTHARYADWDGAYVMGALSRSERLEFEDHLEGCPVCTESIADLGVLPGLLARLTPDDAAVLLRPAADPPAALDPAAVVVPLPASPPGPWWRRGVLRSAGVRIGVAVAAAAVVVAAIAVPIAVERHDTPVATVAVALQQTRPSPITAQVGLTTVAWGTRVDMTCVYAGTYGGQDRPYSLYVVDRAGRAQLVSSWNAGPGETTRTSGSTHLGIADIAGLQLRAGDGTVLLKAAV